jgi:glycosyltransferase involved in cell wall biosynthesis
MLLFSIIVPIYKVENYLRQCLGSVLAQTFTDYECILVDDGSPDSCPAICDEYVVKDTRFSVIHKENGGLSDARNVGIQAAIGEYIVLLDSDDLFASCHALQNLCTVIQEAKEPVIFNSNLITFVSENNPDLGCDSIDKTIEYYTPVQFYKKVMGNKRIIMTAWSFVVRRDFLVQHNLFFKRGILHEDEHWMPRVVCSVEKIAINHNTYYAYRTERNNSITSAVNSKSILDKVLIIKEIQNWAVDRSCPLKNKKILNWRNAQIWLGVFSQISILRKNNNNDYLLILNELRVLRYILFYGKGFKYKVFFFISCIGVSACSKLISLALYNRKP